MFSLAATAEAVRVVRVPMERIGWKFREFNELRRFSDSGFSAPTMLYPPRNTLAPLGANNSFYYHFYFT